MLRTLVARMEAVEQLLDHSVKPEGETAPGRTAIQIALVQIFVKSMNIELALAKLEASVKATVDFSVLGRAIENIGELTTDFLVTVRGIASKMTAALRDAGERLRPLFAGSQEGSRRWSRKSRRAWLVGGETAIRVRPPR